MTQQIFSYLLLSLLFVLAPLYSYPNLGGVGLNMPFNIAEWAMAIIFMGTVSFFSLQKQSFGYTRLFLYCLFFPFIIMLLSFFTEVAIVNVWLFRLLYIVAGFVFIMALLQLKFTMTQVDQLLYMIVVAMAIHTLVAVLQVIDISDYTRKIPMSGRSNSPFGLFQQVNLLATYLVTGLMTILFLISRPSFSAKPAFIKLSFIIVFGVAVYIVLATGSRVGLFSLLISMPVLLLSRRKQLVRHKRTFFSIILVSGIAVLANTIFISPEYNSGLNKTMEKVHNLSQAEYKTYREGMYKISIDLIWEKPLLGHGFTSFPRVWIEQKSRFITQYPNAAVSPLGTGHPHNELLLWLIEGGVVTGLGLFIIFLAICRALYYCGWSRGGAYLALLLPISLHTQTAWPFYGSAVHWFLWLFIIYIVFRHQQKSTKFILTPFTRYLLQIIVVVLTVTSLYFLWHSHKAHDQLRDYMRGEQADMQLVLDNAYFHRFAEKVLMQSLLYTSIEKQNKVPIPNFIVWAEGRLAVNAEPGMFIMLNDAYGFMDDKKNQCRIARKGIQVYPVNARLQKTVDKCL
ncbi:MAG: hypothetical protein COA95_07100 [Methylophaga sp.]|nr:MAG: hypothetical protein COA95_07100 [Methylophaga sp.]